MSLEQNIAGLVTATTSLTEAVNVKKQSLDEAVYEASTSAQNAAESAGLAVAAQTDIHTNWQDKLDTASQQAGIATTQASIATTQASNASGSAIIAEEAKIAAESARDAALVSAETYPDEATGRAAVADGEYFKVIGSGNVAAREYRKTNASTSVLVSEYPSVSGVTILVKDSLRASVEAASGGSYTVVYTPKGQPNFLFRQPAFNLEDVAPGGELGTGLHPAFIFNGVADQEIFIGAYPAAMINGEVVCQPGRDPATSISFDNARAACQALGSGWDIMSNWDWAAIAFCCMANGFEPRGNTDRGRNHYKRWETGTRVVSDVPGSSTNSNGRTLTGSGTASWAHNNTPGGIHDLVGNVWECNQGLILDNNVFKVAPDNGTYLESEFIDTAYEAAASGTFSTRTYVDPPLILKQALAVPASASLAPTGYFHKNAEGLRFAYRGGTWASVASAGLGALYCDNLRTVANIYIGFRPRFRNL